VVGPGGEVGLTRTAAKVERHPGETRTPHGLQGGKDVSPSGGALEPVENQDQGGGRIRIPGEVQVQKVSVGGRPTLAPEVRSPPGAKRPSEQGLRIGTSGPPRGSEGCGALRTLGGPGPLEAAAPGGREGGRMRHAAGI
jgi:hypothetical protein